MHIWRVSWTDCELRQQWRPPGPRGKRESVSRRHTKYRSRYTATFTLHNRSIDYIRRRVCVTPTRGVKRDTDWMSDKVITMVNLLIRRHLKGRLVVTWRIRQLIQRYYWRIFQHSGVRVCVTHIMHVLVIPLSPRMNRRTDGRNPHIGVYPMSCGENV